MLGQLAELYVYRTTKHVNRKEESLSLALWERATLRSKIPTLAFHPAMLSFCYSPIIPAYCSVLDS